MILLQRSTFALISLRSLTNKTGSKDSRSYFIWIKIESLSKINHFIKGTFSFPSSNDDTYYSMMITKEIINNNFERSLYKQLLV